MLQLSKVFPRQIWRSAHAWSSGRHLGVPPLLSTLSTPALSLNTLQDSVLASQSNNSRSLSTSKPEEFVANPYALIAEESEKAHAYSLAILKDNTTSEEMFNIASYYHINAADSLYMYRTAVLLIGKALNAHLFNDGTLTNKQVKFISLMELSALTSTLHDDIGDNKELRFDIPPVHRVANVSRVIMTANFMMAATLKEAAKLSDDASCSICFSHERICRARFMARELSVPYGDRLAHYVMVSDYKTQLTFWLKGLAQLVGANELLSDIMSRFGFNLAMFNQLIDDMMDYEEDLRDGRATAMIIFALKEHPVLEEMIMRRFKNEGDVEKTLELVRCSNAKEETKNLAARYYTHAKVHLETLGNSHYKDALLEVFRHHFELKFDSI